ncbi:sporulation-specific diadenylate cyclase CdaS [Alicyclobacillus fastidiosus]|uniref:Diadenylate cyclase n=1 Tax=Alicyclobacillus fastidiosus TaxID=392011 RepID=A0ABV5ABG4_9BACL|nr:sporulation-specific diadenylate cyclase CdaS [Alicyclobacillus fastidiosus]WEH10474.1 sporulation-specific diadenylate cyclase CdaS [Alicyclobacillus fastidiosus]
MAEVTQTTYALPASIKDKLKLEIEQIRREINLLFNDLDRNDHCILCEFEKIHEVLRGLHATAATSYLQTYLAPYTDNYQAISIAVQHLSERRHGALIVVQREESLDKLIHSGIPIGATLSSSLLESIFFPGGPLHDGAVLVRDNEIISASNVLPVSNIAVGESKLGTRHRAAIGLSQHSDALILIVSEETGATSFAFGGKLFPFSATQIHG